MTEQGKAPAAQNKRVYIVEVQFSLPVLAENYFEAERAAELKYARKEWAESGASNAEYAAWALKRAGEWAASLPWGGDGVTTIAAYLAASQSEPAEGRPSPEIRAIPDSKG